MDLHRNLMAVEFGSFEAAHAFDLYKYPHVISDLIDVLTGVLAPLQRASFLLEVQREEERKRAMMDDD